MKNTNKISKEEINLLADEILQNGNMDAYQKLYSGLYDTMVNSVYSKYSNSCDIKDVEDAVQDCFVELLEPEFVKKHQKNNTNFKGLLYSMVESNLKNNVKYNGRIELTDFSKEADSFKDPSNVEDEVIDRIYTEQLREKMGSVPFTSKEREVEEYKTENPGDSYSSIASNLGISETALRDRIVAMRNRTRNYFAGEKEDEWFLDI